MNNLNIFKNNKYLKNTTQNDYLTKINAKKINKRMIKKLISMQHINISKYLNFIFHETLLKDEIENSYIPSSVWVTGAPLLWLQGHKGENVTVGVIDTGIDPNHKDLQNVNKRYSFVGDDDFTKLHFHGTHVAGIIGANGNIKGVAPNVILNDYRVFDEQARTNARIISSAIIKAVDDGCDILNLSLGMPTDNSIIKKAIDYANKKNVLSVVAAGNESEDVGWGDVVVSYPANYSSVMSVAAVDYNTQIGKVTLTDTKFSNRNREIDVCADGYRVVSTFPSLNGEERYGIASGTSMACPHVAGFSALMLSKSNYVNKDDSHKMCDLYTLVKSQTVPINVGDLEDTDGIIDIVTGAGFVTAYPEMPTRNLNNELLFYLPNLNLFAPVEGKNGL